MTRPCLFTIFGTFVIAATMPLSASEPISIKEQSAQPKTDHAQAIARLIEDLGNDHYLIRQSAKSKLIQHANRLGTHLLRPGVQHRSFEVRTSVTEIIDTVLQQQFENNLKNFADPQYPAKQLSSGGWDQFSEILGDDMASRLAFAELCRRHRWAYRSLGRLDAQSNFSNPFEIDPDDFVSWMRLLLTDLDVGSSESAIDTAAATQIARVANTLSQPSLGFQPKLAGPDLEDFRGIVFKRLVTRWLADHQTIIDRRTAMRVALRYRCKRSAVEIAKRVFQDPRSSPSASVMALMTLAKLSASPTAKRVANSSIQSTWQQCVSNARTDQRTAHVWQLIASQKIRVETKVSDVAIALLLDQADQDPRQYGFAYLEADPLLRFRDYSLGFESDQARQNAYAKALDFFGTQNGQPLDSSQPQPATPAD
jgi:hypothetical protein